MHLVASCQEIKHGLVDADVGFDARDDPGPAAGVCELRIERLDATGREPHLLHDLRPVGQHIRDLGDGRAEALRVLLTHEDRSPKDLEAGREDGAVAGDHVEAVDDWSKCLLDVDDDQAGLVLSKE